jgi:hypothetical protein
MTSAVPSDKRIPVEESSDRLKASVTKGLQMPVDITFPFLHPPPPQ